MYVFTWAIHIWMQCRSQPTYTWNTHQWTTVCCLHACSHPLYVCTYTQGGFTSDLGHKISSLSNTTNSCCARKETCLPDHCSTGYWSWMLIKVREENKPELWQLDATSDKEPTVLQIPRLCKTPRTNPCHVITPVFAPSRLQSDLPKVPQPWYWRQNVESKLVWKSNHLHLLDPSSIKLTPKISATDFISCLNSPL